MSSLKSQLAGLHPQPGIKLHPQPGVRQPRPAVGVPAKRPSASVKPSPSSDAYAALQPPQKVHLENFPLRLSRESIDKLNEWKRTRPQFVPGLLVREIVEKGIAELDARFKSEKL